MLGFFKPYMFESFMRPRTILTLLLLAWAFQSAHSFAAPSSVATSRVAGGDMPLNLLEVDGRWLISTNSGWHNAYLQSYDEQNHKVSGHIELPAAWYGLAYDAKRKLVIASSAESSLYVIIRVQIRRLTIFPH